MPQLPVHAQLAVVLTERRRRITKRAADLCQSARASGSNRAYGVRRCTYSEDATWEVDSLADRGRLTLLEKGLSLAVAVLSLLAALLGYQTARLASQTGGPSAGPDGRAASASPTRSPKQAADRTTDAAVRNAGRIAVGDGSINLDAMPGDSRWGLDSKVRGGTSLESYAGANSPCGATMPSWRTARRRHELRVRPQPLTRMGL